MRNQDDFTIHLVDIQSTCGCVEPLEPLLPFELAAGSTRAVNFAVETGVNPGEMHRTVLIRDDRGIEATLELRCDVIGSWALSADSVDFGLITLPGTGDDPTRRIEFSSTVDSPLRVLALDAPWIEVSTSALSEGRHEIVLVCRRRQLSVGVSSGTVVVETTCAAKPLSAVYVTARGLPGEE